MKGCRLYHVRACEVDTSCVIGDHEVMPASPRCAAMLRNGQPCDRTVAVDSEFCVHHTKLLATVDLDALRHGRTPKKRTIAKQTLRVVPDDDPDTMTPVTGRSRMTIRLA